MKKPSTVPPRHQLRLDLLQNGYEPIPLDSKACYIEGWSRDNIDEQWLAQYARWGAYDNTGLRCAKLDDEQGLVAIDFDVDDLQHCNELMLLANEILNTSSFVRTSTSTRQLTLYWTDQAFRRKRSGMYAGHRVEVLCRGSQFAAFGKHPSGNDYIWPDSSPLTTAVENLPTVTEEQIDEFLIEIDAYFEALHIDQDKPPSIGSDAPHDFSLTDDMQFEVTDPELGLMSVANIKEQIGKARWWCNLTALRSDSDSQAGRISMSKAGLRISDFTTDTTYFESMDIKPANLSPDIADLIKPRKSKLFGNNPQDELEDLLTNHVVVADGTVRHINDPLRSYTKRGFELTHSRQIWATPNGGKKPVLTPIFSHWIKHDRCQRVAYAMLRPETPERFIDTSLGQRILNTYVAPVHDATGGRVDVFDRFMAHLCPIEVERELVIDWLAHKVQNPHIRMHGLVMVARDTFGVGRGTLWDIICRLIGQRYCVETTLSHVVGHGSQSQYNDFLSENLMIHIGEARELNNNVGKWYAANSAYENLKNVVDTAERQVLVRRKTVANVPETIYASTLIATNHWDALAIADGDRRLIVVENGGVMSREFAKEVHDWMGSAANIAELYRTLRSRQVAYSPRGIPLMTDAKQRMIKASANGPDLAWLHMVEELRGDLITFKHWQTFAEATRREHQEDVEWPPPHEMGKVLRRILKDRGTALHLEGGKQVQVKVDGEPVRPWIIRNTNQWRLGEELTTEWRAKVRAEIALNGTSKSTVVALPQLPRKPTLK